MLGHRLIPLSSCLPLAAGHVERACVQIALASVSIGLQEVFVLEIKKNTNVTFTQEIREEDQPTPTNPRHTQSRWPAAAPPPRCDTPHTASMLQLMYIYVYIFKLGMHDTAFFFADIRSFSARNQFQY